MIRSDRPRARAKKLGVASTCVLLLAGCTEGRTVVIGAVNPGTRTLIVGLSQSGQLEAWALEPTEPLELELPAGFSESEPINLSRVQLRQTMAELRLEGGMLRPAPPPNRAIASLPNLGTEVAVLSLGELSEFAPGAIVPELADLKIPSPKPCPRFSFEPVPLDLDFSQGTVTLSDGRAVLAGLRGLAVLGPEGPLQTLRFTPEFIYRVALDPEGGAWILTSRSLSRLDLDTGERTPVVDTSSISRGSAALVVTRAEPVQAYVLTPSADLYLVEDGVLRFQRQLDTQYLGRPTVDRTWLTRTNEGTLLAGANYFVAVAELDGATYRYFRPPGVPRGFAGVGRTRDGRFVVADSFDGTAYVRSDGAWVPGPGLTTRIFSFAPFGDGDELIYASNEGLFGVFSIDEVSPCEPVPVANFAGPRDIVRVGDRYFVSGTLEDNTSLEGWLTPR